MTKDKVKINVKEKLVDNILDLSLSEIKHIPVKEISSLRRATVLDLSTNCIKYLPKNFGSQLVQFTRIDLSKNQLKFLPDEFGNLVNLKHLDLYNNQLENLPITFGKLQKLKYLDLKNNPLQPALQKIVGPCITSKDCCEAAKNVVPYYVSLEKKLEKEKRKRAEQEEKEREEEAQRQREAAWAAKKAARKERKMLEKQNIAEEETKLIDENLGKSEVTFTQYEVTNSPKIVSILKVFKTVLLLVMLITTFLSFFVKFFPDKSKALISNIPAQYKAIIYETFKKINEYFLQLIGEGVKK